MEKLSTHIVLLLICILSRLLSSINYIEDPESLRVAISVFENFDSAHYHLFFSEHPLFFLVAKILYLIFRNISVVFSIIGGTSVFFIIVFILRLINVPLISLEGVLTTTLIFFNPLLWIVSNKYLPDVAGVAITIAAFYYLVPDTYKKYDLYKGWFLAGILGGVKFSFLTFLILPILYALIFRKKIFGALGSFILGNLIWAIPVLLIFGWNRTFSFVSNELIDTFRFNSFAQNYSFWELISRFIQSVWADGLGGYWIDRTPTLLLISIGLIACLIFGLLILSNFGLNTVKVGILVLSILIYSIHLIIFGNIMNESEGVLLILPFFSILLSYGIIYFLVNFNYLYIKVFTLFFLLGIVFLTVVLAVQHTYPSAMAQAKEYILNKKEPDERITVIASPEVVDFLKSQNIDADFIPVSESSLFSTAELVKNSKQRVLLIGNFYELRGKRNVVHFTHNPYINRNSPDLYVYDYF
jgi:hypothetical protein